MEVIMKSHFVGQPAFRVEISVAARFELYHWIRRRNRRRCLARAGTLQGRFGKTGWENLTAFGWRTASKWTDAFAAPGHDYTAPQRISGTPTGYGDRSGNEEPEIQRRG